MSGAMKMCALEIRRVDDIRNGDVIRRYDYLVPADWQVVRRCEGEAVAFGCKNGLHAIVTASRELDGREYLHVSISRQDCLPSYDDLCKAKRDFIGEGHEAYQVFPRASKHVNIHPFCLHLWAPLEGPVLPDFTRGTGQI